MLKIVSAGREQYLNGCTQHPELNSDVNNFGIKYQKVLGIFTIKKLRLKNMSHGTEIDTDFNGFQMKINLGKSTKS